jgi:hypothetical protein
MRRGIVIVVALLTCGNSACVAVLSHSYAYTAVDRRPTVSETDSSVGYFHLTEPVIETSVIDSTRELEKRCGGHNLVNVQTNVTMREFLLIQLYTVRVSAICTPEGPKAGPHAVSDRPDTSMRHHELSGVSADRMSRASW